MSKKRGDGIHSLFAKLARYAVTFWMLFNVIAFPLVLAEGESETVISVDSDEPSPAGSWGKTVAWGLPDDALRLDGEKEPPIKEKDAGSLAFPRAPWRGLVSLIGVAILASLGIGRMGKRSQITIFILLGLVTLIVFFFMFYLSSSQHGQVKDGLESATRNTLETSAIKYYVYTCLDQAGVEALERLGHQGGFFFSDQNGSIISWEVPRYEFTLDNVTYNVSYQIYSSTTGALEPKDTFIRDDLPGDPHNYYPCKTGYASAFYDSVQGEQCLKSYNHTLEGFGSLGQKIIRSGETGLQSEKNHRVIPDLCTDPVDLNVYACSCPASHECNYSIQRQLESYILNRTIACLNFTDRFSGYTVTFTDPSINVTIDTDDVGVILTLPLTISYKGGIPVTKINEFHTLFRVRLKSIHPLLFGGNLILPDGMSALDNITGIVNDELRIDHDLIYDGQPSLNMVGGMIIKTYEPDTNVTIVVINDTESNLRGYPYLFLFAMENRKPALDWYSPSTFVWEGNEYQYKVVEGEPINMTPFAMDPDSDQLIYSYKGWKAGWDDVFNDMAIGFSDMMTTDDSYSNNDWQESDSYIFGCSGNPADTGRCASYMTDHQDVGYHNLTINVTDPNGEQDWQRVRVLVDDRPRIAYDLENFYGDVDNTHASIEDHFRIDVSATSDLIGSGPILFLWEDLDYPDSIPVFYRELNSSHTALDFPFEGNPPWDIVKIHLDSHAFSDVGTHSIRVIASRDLAQSNRTFEVQVHKCLPHRSNAAPYPWNDPVHTIQNTIHYEIQGDPFQADHTCCAPDFTITTGNECYHLTDYGPYEIANGPPTYLSYQSPGIMLVAPSSKQITQVIGTITPTPNNYESFDVYRRDFVVTCDGTSGNTCNSTNANTEHTLTKVLDCPTDLTKHEACSYGVYGTTPQCADITTGSAIDFSTRRVTVGFTCDDTFSCSSYGINSIIGTTTPGGCSGGSCYRCQKTCGPTGKCDWGVNCLHCATCTDGASGAVCI